MPKSFEQLNKDNDMPEQTDFLNEDGTEVVLENKKPELLTDAERRRRHIEEISKKRDVDDDFDTERGPYQELVG